MPNIDRRKLLHVGIAFAMPWGVTSLLSGCGRTADNSNSDGSTSAGETDKPSAKPYEKEKEKEKTMQVHYLEIVTPEVDALCDQYSKIHGIEFGDPIASLGNARTAKFIGGGQIGIRGPLREDESPVIRPYVLVENIEEAVAAAKDSGAEIAIASMEVPGHGTIAVVIQGGIECGLWQV